MTMRTVTVFALPILLVAALAGCTPGGGPSDGGDGTTGSSRGDTPSSGTVSGHSDTACLVGKTWTLDVQDQAAQLLDYMHSKGHPTSTVSGSGSQQIYFLESGAMAITFDPTFVFVTPLESSGLTMTSTQHQVGQTSSDWAWIGNTNVIGFTGWISNITMETTTDINGTVSTTSTPLPAGSDAGGHMTVVCSGDHLTTTTTGSPFTMQWNAEH